MNKLFEGLGKGIKFPFSFSETGSVDGISYDKGIEKVKENMFIILSTFLEERLFNPEFGSKLPEVPFELEDEGTKDLLYLYTVEALERWEQRITINNVYFEENDNILNIIIDFSFGSVKMMFVYPYSKTGMPYNELFTKSKIMVEGGEE